MKIKSWFTALLLLITFGFIPVSLADAPPTINGKVVSSISTMLSNIMPGVVNVMVIGETRALAPQTRSRQKPFRPSPNENEAEQQATPYFRQFQEMGSGVVVDAQKGYVVTNAHVVVEAKLVTITLTDGRRFKAKVIGIDKLSDIAVLQIKADKLTAIPFGNSDDLKVGDFVAAIGNPFGLHETVTSGVISALHRSDLGIEGYENFIQTDASINPGNSGGALVNLQGQLIGINTALIGPITGNVGIGLAIPSNMVKEIFQQLAQYGKVRRGVLGVMVQDLTPALADAFNISGKRGALVTAVTPGLPAQRAGLQAQDVIESINGTEITSAAQLRNMLGLFSIGSQVTIKFHRKDKPMSLTTKIMDPKEVKQVTEPGSTSLIDGIRLTTIDQFIPDFGPVKGAGVVDVDPMSNAWISGLRPGDVILEANGQAVTNIDALAQIAKSNPQRLLLKVGRDRGIIFLVLYNYE